MMIAISTLLLSSGSLEIVQGFFVGVSGPVLLFKFLVFFVVVIIGNAFRNTLILKKHHMEMMKEKGRTKND